MADATVGVREPDSPSKLIDNEQLTVNSQTVYRQRVQNPDIETLVARMFNKQAKVGYALWIDTTDVSYIYIAEAPSATVGSVTGFQGIRIPKATGGVNGKIATSVGFIWNDRAAPTPAWS